MLLCFIHWRCMWATAWTRFCSSSFVATNKLTNETKTLSCTYPCTDVTGLVRNQTNALCMLIPIYSHCYTAKCFWHQRVILRENWCILWRGSTKCTSICKYRIRNQCVYIRWQNECDKQHADIRIWTGILLNLLIKSVSTPWGCLLKGRNM